MTSAEQVIERIEVAGGELTVCGDRIRCRLPEDAAHLLDDLKAHKTEVIVCLKQRTIPPMPDGVLLVRWEPKPAPVILTRTAVVNDVGRFIADTLMQLGKALRSKQGPTVQREMRELVDRLEQCGVIVQILGVGSAVGGRR